ncbi:NAD(P)/FAD-dependent oxidoreductase [Paenibacillus sp. alder61]|uniref:NAD(P)/FAD-dependent oxidoreductase n=1 Tax=Paenibacillus faecis TaxID=862114 RepID=A0A5D0CW67_9BACL|nr:MULTISPECIES: NAD(P)/FAD-dependent oxidoreductase [Paenibacillus]MCA1296340.1 NAD(P)/FAD-dependent oxidoreductase [Paenibacillus sp. alder61]TYA14171.1 NAD(P)/FAD-dependent oxidoreductase [Paenibacillus faecis]
MVQDCIIVGGGIAGLQAAIQLGRYDVHRILVLDAERGRSVLCRNYRNILGFPEGISGPELRKRGRLQAESLGVLFQTAEVVKAERAEETFKLTDQAGNTYITRTLLLATGITDRIPGIAGMADVLGSTVYICPDCDGHEIQDRDTVLMGAGDAGADMALVLAERARSLVYINHEAIRVTEDRMAKLRAAGIRYETGIISEVVAKQGDRIDAVILEDGRTFAAERGFIAFGGNRVHSDLAGQLGVELSGNRHVLTDPRSKKTNVEGVFAAGDLGVHAEQVTVAMGEGSLAAIWIHKALRP